MGVGHQEYLALLLIHPGNYVCGTVNLVQDFHDSSRPAGMACSDLLCIPCVTRTVLRLIPHLANVWYDLGHLVRLSQGALCYHTREHRLRRPATTTVLVRQHLLTSSGIARQGTDSTSTQDSYLHKVDEGAASRTSRLTSSRQQVLPGGLRALDTFPYVLHFV